MQDRLQFFIGTRGRNKRYGPQSQDMSLSELISVFTPEQASTSTMVVFPDLTSLIHRMDEKIREHFWLLKEDALAQAYDVLFNTWTQVGSIADPLNRSRRWEKVMDISMNYILQAQKMMPEPIRINSILAHDLKVLDTKGRMYCEAVLFHIVARAAFEPGSLSNDVTLRGYCQWMKRWVESYICDYDLHRLMLSTAMDDQLYYPALQTLTGDKEQRDASNYLADLVRETSHKKVSHYSQRTSEFSKTLLFQTFDNIQWRCVEILRDLHYRLTCLEDFLGELEKHGKNVDFTRTGETGEAMKAYLAQIENRSGQQPHQAPNESEPLGLPAQ